MCTTIIESGLDVPNANTLIVDRADMLGLAQLYQLRGRVGRSAERAFAYFFFPEHREMTEEAHLRLATIAKHQALGSGFKIALRDLEIRGAGNMLGAEQSGHIASVGFDAYARILAESVNELRGAPVEQESELRIDLPVKAFIPPGWLAQEALRLELYRRIGMARDHEGLAMIRDETADRFGALPDPVQVLFAIGSLRLTAQRLGVEEITTYRDQVRLKPVTLSEVVELGLSAVIKGATFAEPTRTLNLVPERVFGADLVGWVESRAATGGRRADRSRAPTAGRRNACPPRRLARMHPSSAIFLACPDGPFPCSSRRRSPRARTRPRRPRCRRLRRRLRYHDGAARQHRRGVPELASLQQTTCGQIDGATDTQAAACNRFSLGAMIQFRMAETYADANDITVDDAEGARRRSTPSRRTWAPTSCTTQLAASGGHARRRPRARAAVPRTGGGRQGRHRRPAGRRRAAEALPAADRRLHHAARRSHPGRLRRRRPRQIYEQVTAPGFTLADFQALAKQESTDPNAPQDGGELTLPAGQLGAASSPTPRST